VQGAREENIPRNWIVKDEILLNLARLKPTSLDGIRLIRGVDERLLKRHGETLIRLIRRPPVAVQVAASSHRTTPKTSARESLLDLLSAVVKLNAEQHAMNHTLLASRKDLEHFLDSPENNKLMEGWRKGMIGDELMAVLQGEVDLRILEGQVIKVGRCG